MNQQRVHEVRIFDRSPANRGSRPPLYVVLVRFSELAHEMMRVKGQSADRVAIQITKNLTRIEMVNLSSSSVFVTEVTHPRVQIDLENLGDPTAHPDGAGTRVWVTLAPPGSMFRPVAGAR
jgi:hypothetical protein